MPKFKTIENHIERRTYLKGKFIGKFIGYLDPKKSDTLYENYYDLEVIKGEITAFRNNEHIRHWETGEPEEFQPIEKFITNLPDSLILEIRESDGSTKSYNINLNDPKLSGFALSNQVYEKNKVFGDISGTISGYLKHFDIEFVKIKTPTSTSKPTITKPIEKIKTQKQTGRTEVRDNYKRWEYYYTNGSTYWGEWKRQHSGSSFSLVEFFSGLLGLLLIATIVIPLIIIGWKILLPIVILGFIIYLITVLETVFIKLFGWFLRILSLVFILFMIFGIISLFNNNAKAPIKKDLVADSEKEIQNVLPDPVNGDSIISHHRIWKDYNANIYSEDINIRVADYQSATSYRNALSIPLQSTRNYNYIVSLIYDFDKNKLDLLYEMFDDLRAKNNLDNIGFAEVIVSLIQDIPYTLILDNACNSRIYNDTFISNYLTNGGKCEGYIKYGLLSPVEFMATLAGDCDTRTLLIFTLLNHYNYEVAMLTSEIYKHSIIGINLPINGISKQIKNKRFVVWETTSQGIPPGIISREISDMRFWNVSLISN